MEGTQVQIDMVKGFILSRTHEQKVYLLRSALDEDFGMYLELVKILLEAPIREGGMATEDIQQIFDEYLRK